MVKAVCAARKIPRGRGVKSMSITKEITIFISGGEYCEQDYLKIPLDRLDEFESRIKKRGYALRIEDGKNSDYSCNVSGRMLTMLQRSF